MEPMEEVVYLDQVKMLAVDHPADFDVYPNEYFASNPPYPDFKVVASRKAEAQPPAGAWDEHGHNLLPDLLAHRYVGDFKLRPFQGIHQTALARFSISAKPYDGGPLVAADARRDRILHCDRNVRRAARRESKQPRRTWKR